MNKIKWFFTSKYKKLLKHMDTQYTNKGGLWVHTDKYTFRLDFEKMEIELVAEVEDE